MPARGSLAVVPGPCSHQHRGGSGEPLVLIHGIGSTWRVWTPIIEALERRHEVFAISLPGYGESPPLAGQPTVPALVDAVEEEMDAAGLDTAHLAGNSLGGWITAELARRGRARSAIAIDPAGLWTPKELAYSVRSLRNSVAMARRLAPYAERLNRSSLVRTLLMGQVQARGWRSDPEEAAYALRAYAGSPSFKATREWIYRNRAMPEGLDQIRNPFLVIWGSWDFLLPVRQAARWERIVPGAELRVLPRLGHVPMADDPELVSEIVLEFTSRHADGQQARREEAETEASAAR
jgi:pimeloyl-ACP methyl ester carboxylesterase